MYPREALLLMPSGFVLSVDASHDNRGVTPRLRPRRSCFVQKGSWIELYVCPSQDPVAP